MFVNYIFASITSFTKFTNVSCLENFQVHGKSSEFCTKITASIASTSRELKYVVREYHIYKDNWEPYIGEALDCVD